MWQRFVRPVREGSHQSGKDRKHFVGPLKGNMKLRFNRVEQHFNSGICDESGKPSRSPSTRD